VIFIFVFIFPRRLRRLYGNFFNPEGLRRFVPQMCKIAKDHFKQHWEGRDEIRLGVMTKQFAFEVACYLFIGMEACPELDGLCTAFTAFNEGLFSFPVRLPGTSFYKAMAGRRHIDRVSDTVIARRREVSHHHSTPVTKLTSN
jgi:cytochrome P450